MKKYYIDYAYLTGSVAHITRAPYKMRIFISIMHISTLNHIFDLSLEPSHRDDSNKWSNIRFCEEIMQAGSIEVNITHLLRIFDIAIYYIHHSESYIHRLNYNMYMYVQYWSLLN